jgi:hypothetical protein
VGAAHVECSNLRPIALKAPGFIPGTCKVKNRFQSLLSNGSTCVPLTLRPEPDLDELLGRAAMNEIRVREKMLKRWGSAR